MKFKGNFGTLTLEVNGTRATGTYQKDGSLQGEFIDSKFKGSWENNGLEGLVEFSVADGQLNGLWKTGLDEGPMKGKWEGTLLVESKGAKLTTNTVERIENPWLKLPKNSPYILPQDQSIIDDFNGRCRSEEFKIVQEMYPEPFIGRVDAPIILLNLNPGFGGKQDLQVHRSDSKLSEVIKKNLSHSITDWPFYFLNPELSNTPGYLWWAKKLKSVINIAGVKSTADNLLCIEFFPYHSSKFRQTRQVLPSQEYTRQLVYSAIRRDAIIIGMRAIKIWQAFIPELVNYHSFFKLNSPQNVAVSPNNCKIGFEMIIKELQANNAD